MNHDEPLRALRVYAATPLASLPELRCGRASLAAGAVTWTLPQGADARAAKAAVLLLCRLAERLGARCSEPVESDGALRVGCERSLDALLLLELLGLLDDDPSTRLLGEARGPTALLERLDRACGAIAARRAAPYLDVVDGVGVFAADGPGGVRIAHEAVAAWSGWIALPESPAPYLDELRERLGVRAAPILLGSGAPALLLQLGDAAWPQFATRLQERAARFVALRPERDGLFAGIEPVAPEQTAVPAPVLDAEAVLAALPDPATPGTFDVELVRAGPDAARTAALLARSAGMSEVRAAELVASAPVRILSGVSAFVVRSLGVALVRGAGAELRANATPH